MSVIELVVWWGCVSENVMYPVEETDNQSRGDNQMCVFNPHRCQCGSPQPAHLDIHDGLIVGTALAYPTEVTGILSGDEMITHCGLAPVVW